MTVSPAPSSSSRESAAEISTAEIDASCRLPLFSLLGGAVFWLALSSMFGLMASLTFHKPSMFSDCAMLSYGRTYPAWSNLLVYGFCIPSGLAIGLWLLARLGRTKLVGTIVVFTAAELWHLGVLIGLIGILRGSSTGFEWLEMPRYAAVILFVAFMLMAMCGFATNQARSEKALYPSQWFVLTALFWFPWIYSTAVLLLDVFPVRGVVQSSVAWWFSGNLLTVWLTLVGLASTFYFIPRLSERPLQNLYLALFAFWTLILFGSWVGIPSSAPLPAWMTALSRNAAVLMALPAVAIALCVLQTLRGAKTKCSGGPFCYMKFGVSSLVLSLLLAAGTGVSQISRVTNFTWFGTAQVQLQLYGFFAMTLSGAALYILPRISGLGLSSRLTRMQFWCMMPGSVLLTLPLFIGGVVQGVKLLNPETGIVDVAKSSMMFLRISTVGELLILFGAFLFLLNVTTLLVRYYRAVCFTAYSAVTAELEPTPAPSLKGNAEVRP